MTNSFKKVFSTFVSLVTILWSVGAGSLAFPVSANAATLNAGDLIKASGPSLYFYANDGKRYVFPNEKTYFSWFNDFSSVKTITDAELAAIPLGKNVTVRPGTKLVKITTDPKTYAVTKCGTLHWIESESVAKALYGDAWATRVVDVPDSFFENYTVGSSIPTNVHPDGQLVTYAGDTNKYVVMGGMKRKIASDAAFAANNWNMINSVATTITYANGADVTGAEADNFWTVSCSSGTTPSVSGSVTVALASDTPAGATVPKNAMSVPMVKVNITAGSADALVTGLSFHRVGVGSTADFANVYLYDQNGARLTTGRSVNSQSNLVSFNSLNQTIPAGSMKSFYVYADFSTPTNTGGNHAFELADAASVVVSGTGTVSGSFPVRGNVFVVGTASAGTIVISKGAQPANPNIGATDVEISNFKLQSVTDDISVKRVTLYQSGSVDNADLKNFALYQGTTKVASAAAVDTNGHITLNFDTPYLITNGTTRVFSLHADVGGRAGRTIHTYVEYATDIMATDMVYNSGAAVDIGSTGTFDGTGMNYVEVTTQGGQLTFAFNGPVSSNVAKGKTGVVLYNFALTSPDNDLEIRHLRMSLDTVDYAGGGRLYTVPTPYFRNIKVIDTTTGATLVGPKELSLTGSDDIQPFDFNDVFTIKAGETKNLAFVADLANNTDAAFLNHQYRGIFNAFQAGDIKVVTTGENLDLSKVVPNSDTTGNTMTIKASSLTVTLASTPITGTIVKKSADKPVLGLSLTAGSQSDITVTNVVLKCAANIAGTTWTYPACLQRVSSLALYDGANKVGVAHSPDSVNGTASITNMNLLVTKGSTKSLTVVATFTSNASTTHQDKVTFGLDSSNMVTAQDSDSNTVDTTGVDPVLYGTGVTQQFAPVAAAGLPPVYQNIINSGSVIISADSHPASTIVIGNKSLDAWVPFARYKAAATYEDMSIDRIRVKNEGGGDDSNFQQIAVVVNGTVRGAATLDAGSTGSKDVDLTSNEIVVPKDNNVSFELWAKLSDVQSSTTAHGAIAGVTRTGMAPYLGITHNVTGVDQWDTAYSGQLNVRTTGVSSGERVYNASGVDLSANPMTIRATKPAVSMVPLGNTALTSGSPEDLYKVQIAGNTAGTVAVKQMTFTISLGGNAKFSSLKLLDGSSDMDTSLYSITDPATGINLKTASLVATSTVKAVVSFTNEITVHPGETKVYTLRGTPNSTGVGNSVSVSMFQEPNPASHTPARAYLLANHAYGGWIANANVFVLDEGTVAGAPSNGAGPLDLGTFVWSDNSENYHSYANQGSYDWTNDVLVTKLTDSASIQN